MNHYQPRSFRPFFGIAAVAMTALTLFLAVGVPAGLAPAGSDAMALAASKRMTTDVTEIAIIPARIDVIGFRDTTVAERQTKPRG